MSAMMLIATTIHCADGAPPRLEELARELLETDEAWAKLEPIGIKGLRSRVARVRLDDRSYIVKRYDYPLFYAARTLLRRSRARREFEALEQLIALLPR